MPTNDQAAQLAAAALAVLTGGNLNTEDLALLRLALAPFLEGDTRLLADRRITLENAIVVRRIVDNAAPEPVMVGMGVFAALAK